MPRVNSLGRPPDPYTVQMQSGQVDTHAPIVVALGGNAISRESEEGNVPQQFANTARTAAHVVDLVEAGRRLVVTHGNGPQVGNVLRRVELAAHEIYTMPLDVCGAHTQGGMGYMIAQCLNNELRRRGIAQTAAALVTMVEVDRDDPEFRQPTKPIGKHYTRERAEQLQREHGWRMTEINARGFRRLVPSPRPRAIVEGELIRRLAHQGQLLVAAGGGGVPVVCNASGELVGVEAVVDKDRTSALLALLIEAETLVIATGIERVALDFGRSTQRFIDQMTRAEARRYLAEGQFPPGSMGPKIEAALAFLDATPMPAAQVIICDLAHLRAALRGDSGTRLVP
jgi:carbamate kinase